MKEATYLSGDILGGIGLLGSAGFPMTSARGIAAAFPVPLATTDLRISTIVWEVDSLIICGSPRAGFVDRLTQRVGDTVHQMRLVQDTSIIAAAKPAVNCTALTLIP